MTKEWMTVKEFANQLLIWDGSHILKPIIREDWRVSYTMSIIFDKNISNKIINN